MLSSVSSGGNDNPNLPAYLLQAQLNKPKLKRILTMLKLATSTYLPAFERLVKALTLQSQSEVYCSNNPHSDCLDRLQWL